MLPPKVKSDTLPEKDVARIVQNLEAAALALISEGLSLSNRFQFNDLTEKIASFGPIGAKSLMRLALKLDPDIHYLEHGWILEKLKTTMLGGADDITDLLEWAGKEWGAWKNARQSSDQAYLARDTAKDLIVKLGEGAIAALEKHQSSQELNSFSSAENIKNEIVKGALVALLPKKDQLPESIYVCGLCGQPADLETMNCSKCHASLFIWNSIGMKLRLIPPGNFMMGSLRDRREQPVHRVAITKPFYCGVHLVTERQYNEVMGKPESIGNRPIESVSWEDSITFCEKLGEKEGVRYRLLTEAEWEYACRAGTATEYYWGDSPNWEDDGEPDEYNQFIANCMEYAWFKDNWDPENYTRSWRIAAESMGIVRYERPLMGMVQR